MERKEAIEVVKKNYPHVNVSGSQFETALRTLIPELKESEDEKIRQLLLRFVKYDMSDNYSDDFTPADCVAWLEKQGKNNMGISEATKQKLEDNLNKALEQETPESFNEFLDEQNPAWSEEDERILNTVIHNLRYPGVNYYKKPIEEEVKWLKSLKDRYTWKPSKEQMEALWNVYKGGKEQAELATLYNDLKKLRDK